jgi:hypothetical protein
VTADRQVVSPPKWRDLEPDREILAALDHAGPRPASDAAQNVKRRWSERFAHRCAVAFATAFDSTPVASKEIRPRSLAEGTEPLTPLGSGTRKRIDVTIVDAMLGLEIGVSLKGLSFRDTGSNNFDKNLTGRLYELGDEMRLVHEHLPHAFMAGVILLPIEATRDKSEAAASSFAHTVQKLRERTGRLDAALAAHAAHAARCDAGFVGLYAHADDATGPRRGVARLFDVSQPPPRRGRPRVSETFSVSEAAWEIARRAMYRETMTWGEAEPEDEAPSAS